ncbi:MAG: beta-galactosidase [Victivallales bacterium]|nr:beta-galactosidase [Victivallales bacterium]
MGKLDDWEPTGRRDLSHRHSMKVDRFWFGAPYYPEHWDEQTRAGDPQRMADAGFNMVRMAEFAWDLMEPQEGIFDFSLFDDTIAKLADKGISTMLCTPTAAPPRWLTVKHPETLRENSAGVAMQHGSRQHCCHSSEVFRKYSRRITESMARHYRDNPNVVAWQTDNEFNCHFAECHCPACQSGFQEFLKKKYDNDISLLNRERGTSFWALTFSSFAEISLPKDGAPAYPNPSHQLDYFRYLSHIVEEFQHDQIEILRQARPEWFIIHNGTHQKTDFRGPFTRDLDALGLDIYPFFNNDNTTRYIHQAYHLDSARALSGNFFIPEHQSGPGGQKTYFHDNPEPNEIRRMTYISVSRGADSLLYFRWRTCRFGAEEYWCGILDHDNIPRRRYDEIAQIGREMRTVGKEILGTEVHIDCAIATGDYDVNEAHNTMHLGLKSCCCIAGEIHSVLFQSGYSIGCVHPEDDLSGIKLYFIPHWALFKPEWAPILEKYVADGGVLVIGARTATHGINNKVVPETMPGCLRKLAGITVGEYGKQNMPEQRPKYICINGKKQITEQWYEVLQNDTAETLAVWAGRHLDNQTAVSVNPFGKGKAVYVGTFLSSAVTELLLPELVRMAALQKPLHAAPEGLAVSIRKNNNKKIWFLINNTDGDLDIPSTPKGTSLLDGKKIDGRKITLPIHGVEIIKE